MTRSRRLFRILAFAGVVGFLLLAIASAQEGPGETSTPAPVETEPVPIDSGDTAWVLASAALVMIMTPGLALFYSGLVRRKNALATIMQCFIILAIISIQWAVIGYSLAFGPDRGGLIGSLDWAFLDGVSANEANPDYAATIPHQAFMIFQAMFAIITPALIVGAMAERISFRALVLFSVIWATLVYDPVAHWVWGVGGWFRALGALDFAGGLVVHLTAGAAALACALYLGHRKGYGKERMSPHNLPLTVLGVGLLWFGWFGFNAGSAVASGGLATTAFVTTHLATAAAAMSWAVYEWTTKGKPTGVGAASGAVAGLVAITPASGFVTPMAALLIGVLAGVVCAVAVGLKDRFRYDDSLDAWGVHGVGGMVGAVATGFFATTAVNPAGKDGLFMNSAGQLGFYPEHFGVVGVQILGIGVVLLYSFALTWGILWGIDRTVGLRVPDEHEEMGLDLSQHGEKSYDL